MALAGSLGAGGGASLFLSLWASKKTGVLDLVIDEETRRFVLVKGEVVYLSSPVKAEKLPLLLVASKKVSKDVMVEASKAGGDLRSQLIERGVPAEVHDRELRAMLARVLAKLFYVTDGSFNFVEKPKLELPGILESNPMSPLFWRIARTVTPDFAEPFLGDLGARVTRSANEEILAELPDLSPEEGYLLSRIDGYCSINDLRDASPMDDAGTFRLLVGLVCVGFIDVAGRPGLKLGPGGGSTVKAPAKPKPKPEAARTPVEEAASDDEAEEQGTDFEFPEEGQVVARARSFLLEIEENDGNYYFVLSIPEDASMARVRKAYYALARVFHPDRIPRSASAEEKDLVEELFAKMSRAFSELSDPARRSVYNQKLKDGSLEEKEVLDPKALARESFGKASTLLMMGEKARAVTFLEHAVETDGENYEYRLGLARALMDDSRSRKRAEIQLAAAIEIDPSNAEAYYLLGVVYKRGKLKSRALEQFKKGLSWDANHEGIQKEMAELMPSDDGSEPSSGGLFGGLLGKK